jgi:hypothetical protein
MKPCALLLAMLLASQAVADKPKPERRRPDLRYVISGAVLFGVFYVIPLALAIRYEEPELAVPVLGPLIDLRRCRDCTGSPQGQGEVAGLVLDALLQAAGVSLFVVGMVRRKPLKVTVAPSLSPTAPGLVVGGRF